VLRQIAADLLEVPLLQLCCLYQSPCLSMVADNSTAVHVLVMLSCNSMGSRTAELPM
jgi:hypothetical protein